MLNTILDFTLFDLPVGAMTLFIGPIILIFVLYVVIKMWLHRKAMINWFYFAIDHELTYQAPKGSLQQYFEVTDPDMARRHRPVPPLLSLNEYVGTITGRVSDLFWVELNVVKAGCIHGHRSGKVGLKSLSDAALDALPDELYADADEGTSLGSVFTLIRIGIPGMPAWLLQRQGFMDSLGARTGLLQDIETGDAEFDKTCLVQGEDPRAIQVYLRSKRRFVIQEAFQNIRAPGGVFLIDAHGLFYCQRGILSHRDKLTQLYTQLLDLAKSMCYLRD